MRRLQSPHVQICLNRLQSEKSPEIVSRVYQELSSRNPISDKHTLKSYEAYATEKLQS